MRSVASRSVVLWLPCVSQGSSTLHSLSPSVWLFVSLLIPLISQLHSPSSSCRLPLSGLISFLLLLTPFFLISSFVHSLHWFPTLWLFLPYCLVQFSFYTVMGSTLGFGFVETYLWSVTVSCYHTVIQQPQRERCVLFNNSAIHFINHTSRHSIPEENCLL